MVLYNLIIYCYGLVIKLASVKKTKARQWVEGRKNWRQNLARDISSLNSQKIIWMHCASYGEFEQGRPLLEAIRTRHPQYKIVLSFFSPSGYEAFKHNNGADAVCYLPLDTPRNARDFISIVKPAVAVFIKYEFWVNFLFALQQAGVPTFLVSAVFKPHHPFFKWYGGLFRRSLKTFHTLFIQDEASGRLLQNIGIRNYEVCGDTRFDRVMEIRKNFAPLPFFEEFCAGHKILIAGSSWPGDEALLINAYKQLNRTDLKLIIAPHNVDELHVSGLLQQLEKNDLPYLQYSKQQKNNASAVLVVDTIGLLSKLYYYATVAYVGGGFDSGIHNCLEPAVYLKPVLFYNHNYQKYNEVVELVALGAAQSVENSAGLAEAIGSLLSDEAKQKLREARLKAYFEKNSGVTEKVLGSMRLD